MRFGELTDLEIEEKVKQLPNVLQSEVGDKIQLLPSGPILPGFKDGVKWNDEFLGSPQCPGEALATYSDQLTQICQWEELYDYARSKGFSDLSEFFRFTNMDSWKGNKWQNWDAYLVRKGPNILTTRFGFKQGVSSILASPHSFPYVAYNGGRGMSAPKKGLYKIRLQNKKAED